MKITKQLLEKRQADAYDKAQLAAYKLLKDYNKPIAAIYAYSTDNDKRVVLDKIKLINNQKEIQDFINSFKKGKEATKVTVDVMYKDQLDKVETALKDRGLLEGYTFKLKEDDEKEFDVIFSDGPTSNRSERTIIKAKDVDDATSKAYKMPQAKRYGSVIVGERAVGKTNYIVAFNYTLINGKGEEVKQPFKNESRIVIEAESESKAISVYNNKCLGKYFEGYSFRNDSKVLDKPVPGKQCGKFGRVFDCYQGGVVPRFKADESLTIEEDVEKDDDFYIKAGILGTDEEIKENMTEHKFKLKEKQRDRNMGNKQLTEKGQPKEEEALEPMTITEAFKHLKATRLSEAVEPNGPIEYRLNVKKNAGEDTPQASGRNREYRNDDYFGFTDEVKKEIEGLPCSKALARIRQIINQNHNKFDAGVRVYLNNGQGFGGEHYDPNIHKDWKLDKQYKVTKVDYVSGNKGYISRNKGSVLIVVSKR